MSYGLFRGQLSFCGSFLLCFFFFKAQNTLPTWIPVVVCTIILGMALVMSILTETSVEYVAQVENKINPKVYYIKSLQADVEMIADNVNDPSLKKQISDLAERIRFSDPMSNDSLSSLERQISDAVIRLKSTPDDDKGSIVSLIDQLLTERNKKCKILK